MHRLLCIIKTEIRINEVDFWASVTEKTQRQEA